ncbi:MAG: TRASH domain-containing protein [Candidatus Altiarchaeales archaeon]|nr:TRASH domain-containing protein [Candidatus Altiarchaeales archaeon]
MDCSFCGREIGRGLESMYVTTKGKIYYFCSSKCDKNLLKLGRSKRKVKWTKAYRKEKIARIRLLKEGVSLEKIKALEKEAAEAERKEAESISEKPAVESHAPAPAPVPKPQQAEKPKEAKKAKK